MERYELQVSGMTCKSCERIVEKEVTQLSGVASVDADCQNDVVTVDGKGGSADAAKKVIYDIGYEVDR